MEVMYFYLPFWYVDLINTTVEISKKLRSLLKLNLDEAQKIVNTIRMKILRDVVDYYRLNRTIKENGLFTEEEMISLNKKGLDREKL